MRKDRVSHFLAGTMLALTAAPMPLLAAPDTHEVVRPVPPAQIGQAARRNDAPPLPAHGAAPVAAVLQTPKLAPPPETARDTGNDSLADKMAALKDWLDRPLAASDSQIGARLREMVTTKQLDRQFERPADRKAVESYYASHGYAPIWIRDGRLTAGAKAVIVQLKNAGADALFAADYPVPDFAAMPGADKLADADVKLTGSMLTYARHLAVGRIAPTRVLVEVDYGNRAPEPAEILKKVADSNNAGAALESFNPPHDGFRALKDKLAELRNAGPRADADERIADGAPIKPGDKDPRIPLLRDRLKVAASAPEPVRETIKGRDQYGRPVTKVVTKPGKADTGPAAALVYDRALFNAIKHIQASADIKPTGVIDKATLAAINGPTPAQKMVAVAANMERWRWLPRDLGKTYVMVNIPDFTLKVVKDNGVVWRTKIVAGKPQTPTPLLTAPMQDIYINPSWYVPQSIIQNELLPQYAADPLIFERMGLEVKRGPDGNINVVQPPGAANALGRIKFAFPNKFQVYLHDTPEKRLFTANKRAFSHGCMRVEDPTKFGEVLLHLAMNGTTPDAAQLSAMYGKEEQDFKLINRPTVHLTYQTAFVDDAGKLTIRDDIYGFDARIDTIMHSDERRIADVAPPPDPKRVAPDAKANQELLKRVERREAQNPFAFFDRIFR